MPISSKIFILLTVATLLITTTAAPQESKLTFLSSVDRTRLGLDDYLTLTVSVSGSDIGGISEPDLPSLDRFEIVGSNSSSSSQYSLINGKMTSSKTVDYIYTLRPQEVGRTTIGSATLKFKGQIYRTEPIEIEVIAGSISGTSKPQSSSQPRTPAPPKPTEKLQSEDLFLRAEFDRKKAYPGQQITVTYVLYNRTSLSNVQYSQLPTFSGFWAEEIYNAERLNFQDRVVGGKRYQVAVLKKLALFPTTSGQIKVDPMELVCDVRVRGGDIFDFFGRTKRVRIANKPISIAVEPLPPEGKPDGFAGAVGQYNITADVDDRRVKAGDPIELTIRVSGQGNLKTLPAPQLPTLDGFKTFEPEVLEKTSSGEEKIGGSKTYKYVLIPKQEGQYRIGAMELVYFDPATDGYRTARTDVIDIEVLPGDQEEYPLTVGLGREEIKLLGKDIRYIKPAGGALRNQGDDLYNKRSFQILQFVPLLIIAAVALARRHRDRISGDVRYARWRKATGRARRGLKEAQHIMRPESSERFYGLLSKTLSQYLGDKLNLAVGGLTRQQLEEELASRRMDQELIDEIQACINACDHSRFAPSGAQRGDMDSLLERVRNLIDRLEKIGL